MKTTELPKQVGGVQLNYGTGSDLPIRQGESISMPLRDGMEMYLLKDGTQFLAIYPGQGRWGDRSAGRTFFGGMDEAPFITSLEAPAVAAFRRGGEESFFAELVPHVIKILTGIYPGAPVARQGDVWSLRLPFTWTEFEARLIPKPIEEPVLGGMGSRRRKNMLRENRAAKFAYKMEYGQFKSSQGGPVRKEVLDTGSHTIRGISGRLRLDAIDDSLGSGIYTVAEGVLEAPDHAPHVLEGGPYVLARTPHITDQRQLILMGGD